MTEEYFTKASKIKSEINHIDSQLLLIDHIQSTTKSTNFPVHFRIQGVVSNALIENDRLNKMIEIMVIDFLKKEKEELQKQFDEL